MLRKTRPCYRPARTRSSSAGAIVRRERTYWGEASMSARSAVNGTFRLIGFIVASVSIEAAALAQAPPTGATMRGDGPPPAAKPFNITRNDPALDQLVASNAK